jgi:hypothetical protein
VLRRNALDPSLDVLEEKKKLGLGEDEKVPVLLEEKKKFLYDPHLGNFRPASISQLTVSSHLYTAIELPFSFSFMPAMPVCNGHKRQSIVRV